jgi:hypothetical protein
MRLWHGWRRWPALFALAAWLALAGAERAEASAEAVAITTAPADVEASALLAWLHDEPGSGKVGGLP